MSRVLLNGINQITNSYENHKGWSKGIDIVKQPSQIENIIAHSDGKIIKVVDYLTGTNKVADKEGCGYGNYVAILHNKKYQNKSVVTVYGHLASVQEDIKEGQTVTKGQILGLMGNTGNSYGAHLHFEIRLYDEFNESVYIHDTTKYEWIDPTPYIDADLPYDASIVIGYLDNIVWDNGVLTCGGWAYQDGEEKIVTIKVYKDNKVIHTFTTVTNKSRPDVKNAMGYATDKVGYVATAAFPLDNGEYIVKAFVGKTQLNNMKFFTVENKALTSKSYGDYLPASKDYYRIRKTFQDYKSSKGSFKKWSGAFSCWNTWKSQGYHIYDTKGNQLD